MITLVERPTDAAQYDVCRATVSYANGRPTSKEVVQVSLGK